MDLVVKQYDENGSQILERMIGKRVGEKKTIIQGLETKSDEMRSVYVKTKEHIHDEVHHLQSYPARDFEMTWQKRQREVKKLMEEGVESLKT